MESTAEGEAQRYFDHALTLKNTILFLRYNKELTQDQGPDIPNIGKLDRCILVFIAFMGNHMRDPVATHLHMSVDVLSRQLVDQIGFCVLFCSCRSGFGCKFSLLSQLQELSVHTLLSVICLCFLESGERKQETFYITLND